VLVQVGAAGLCRTDLHSSEGQWAEKSGVQLPYVIGHENAGWVREVGSAVTNVRSGDAVILHPLVTCGLRPACRAGVDEQCEKQRLPGIDSDGGMAELMLTSARSVLKLAPGLEPVAVAALADAGLTAYHAVRPARRVIASPSDSEHHRRPGRHPQRPGRPDGAGGNPPPEPGDPVLRP